MQHFSLIACSYALDSFWVAISKKETVLILANKEGQLEDAKEAAAGMTIMLRGKHTPKRNDNERV